MAGHEEIAARFGEGVYFAHAGKPWQRPTKRNCNEPLRQYFPKGSDLRIFSADELRQVEERINARPRKTFPFRTFTRWGLRPSRSRDRARSPRHVSELASRQVPSAKAT